MKTPKIKLAKKKVLTIALNFWFTFIIPVEYKNAIANITMKVKINAVGTTPL